MGKPKKKTKLDNAEEKENKNLAKLSWPEQLVRSKAAKVAAAAASSRATTTSRHSVVSLDSMEMELATPEDKIPSLGNSSETVATTTPIISNNHDTSTKSKQTTTAADVKNSKNSVKSTSKSRQPIVVLPILGKNKILNAMGSKSKQTANQDQEYNSSTASEVDQQKSNSKNCSKKGAEQGGGGRPKRKSPKPSDRKGHDKMTGTLMTTSLAADQPPNLEPQVTIPSTNNGGKIQTPLVAATVASTATTKQPPIKKRNSNKMNNSQLEASNSKIQNKDQSSSSPW